MLIDFAAEGAKSQAGTATTRRNVPVADRPQAKTWINIGYELNGKFVNLPLGMALDTMEPAQRRGTDPEWLKLVDARNNLLKGLQAFADQLPAGAEASMPKLEIRIRKVKDETIIDPATNEFADVDFAALFTGEVKLAEPKADPATDPVEPQSAAS